MLPGGCEGSGGFALQRTSGAAWWCNQVTRWRLLRVTSGCCSACLLGSCCSPGLTSNRLVLFGFGVLGRGFARADSCGTFWNAAFQPAAWLAVVHSLHCEGKGRTRS